jgi:hypothetical protein
LVRREVPRRFGVGRLSTAASSGTEVALSVMGSACAIVTAAVVGPQEDLAGPTGDAGQPSWSFRGATSAGARLLPEKDDGLPKDI